MSGTTANTIVSINNPYATGIVRRPRMRVLIGGTYVPGCLHAHVVSNGSYQADKYSAQFALWDDPNFDPIWWGNLQPGTLVDVQLALLDPSQDEDSPDGYTSIIVGEIDEMDLKLTSGTVDINGRDLTSRFIDTKVQNLYKNQTASDVAKQFAAEHNMTADVDPTTDLIGRFYSDDHDHIGHAQHSKAQSEWQFLTYFAQQEYPSYDVWVSGTTLHYKKAVPPGSTPWIVLWGQIQRSEINPSVAVFPQSNAQMLTFKRSLTLAKDITVTVQSFNPKTGKSIIKVIKTSGAHANKASGVAQNYVKVLHSADEATCLRVGQSILEDLTKHERVISWEEPGDTRLNFRTLVQVVGSGSSWDQTYYIDEITFDLTQRGGFKMTVRAKNHSPNSQVVVQ